jgi:hypothetical protein
MSTVSSDFNLQKISTKEFSEHVRATIEFGDNLAVFARRGAGKTTIAKQIIVESGYKEVYLNTSLCERCDFNGYPKLFDSKSENKYVDYLLPQYFRPLIEGNKQDTVLLLDEVDKANQEVWAPLLEITQFRTINGRELSNLKAVIMTGNLQAEGGQRPCLPLLDRASKYLMEANTSHWLDWAARTRSIHPSITAFISDHGDELFGDVDPGDVYADPSPRGWHNASNILFFGEEKRWSPKLLTAKVAGCVGKKTGLKYSSYFDHYVVLLPYVERIMKGEQPKDFDKLEPSKRCVCCMIVCSRLAKFLYEMKPNKK